MLKIIIKSVLFGVIGRVIPCNLRVFTFEKREILRFGCIFEGLLSAKPCFFSIVARKARQYDTFWLQKVILDRFGLPEPPGSLLGASSGSLLGAYF